MGLVTICVSAVDKPEPAMMTAWGMGRLVKESFTVGLLFTTYYVDYRFFGHHVSAVGSKDTYWVTLSLIVSSVATHVLLL